MDTEPRAAVRKAELTLDCKLALSFGTKRAAASATHSRALSSHAMMRLLLGRRLTLFGAMALAPCLAFLLPPFLSFMFVHRLRGGAQGGTPAASKDLIGLSSRKERDELEMVFSYDGWRRDAKLAEEMHKEHPNLVPHILDTMRRKQQVHSGDRSHPYIRRLDALMPTLSYNGWEDDARKTNGRETNAGTIRTR